MITYWFVHYMAKVEGVMRGGENVSKVNVDFIPIEGLRERIANNNNTSSDKVIIKFFCQVSKETYDEYMGIDGDTNAPPKAGSNKTTHLKLV